MPRPKGTKHGTQVRVHVSLSPEDFEWFVAEAERVGVPLGVLASSALLEYRQPKMVR
jgi:hypothetical protein